MTYLKTYDILYRKFNTNQERIEIPELGIEIHNLDFKSEHFNILPGEDGYFCKKHDVSFNNEYKFAVKGFPKHLNDIINLKDSKIKENISFTYPIIRRLGKNDKNSIILFHGLNEKSWEKYLPWGRELCLRTKKNIILMPMAFHMNRTPEIWSNPRIMHEVSKWKTQNYPKTSSSSLANAALNMRLQFMPQRFLWSGLQSYYDVIELVKQIKTGNHPIIDSSAKIDFFSYSIGSFLAEILMMRNHDTMFNESRLFNFCGGPILSRTNPVSKYILDSEANIAVYSFFIENLESEIKRDKRLAHYFGSSHPVGEVFRSMLDYQKKKEFRESKFRELSKRIMAIGLKKDMVIPPFEIINTLKGEDRKIPIKIKVLDFDFAYDHVVPFPRNEKIEKKVDKAFKQVFKIAAKFLG